MGITLDCLRGAVRTYVTCDSCGHPILGTPQIDPPSGARDYERFSHRDGECPDDPCQQEAARDEPTQTVGDSTFTHKTRQSR